MPQLNPDFKGIDEVIVPPDATFGWSSPEVTEREAIDLEDRMYDAFGDDMPIATRLRPARAGSESMLKAWDEFQVSKGRQPNSNDLTLLDEFIHGKRLLWLPQIIGSCVWSNTFRALVERHMYEVALLGQPQEYLGRNEFGPQNYAPYGPWSYGMARRRANMRRGDGLYCAPMAESMVKDGFVPCDSPKLTALLTRLGRAREKDYPEPQDASLYRAFGSWQYLDELKPDAGNPLVEAPRIRSADELYQAAEAGKPVFVCSSDAIKKVGVHSDGFPIHARDKRKTWAHNMHFAGFFKASDGEIFIPECNQSWGEQHVYYRRLDEIASEFNRYSCAAVGESEGLASSPPTVS